MKKSELKDIIVECMYEMMDNNYDNYNEYYEDDDYDNYNEYYEDDDYDNYNEYYEDDCDYYEEGVMENIRYTANKLKEKVNGLSNFDEKLKKNTSISAAGKELLGTYWENVIELVDRIRELHEYTKSVGDATNLFADERHNKYFPAVTEIRIIATKINDIEHEAILLAEVIERAERAIDKGKAREEKLVNKFNKFDKYGSKKFNDIFKNTNNLVEGVNTDKISKDIKDHCNNIEDTINEISTRLGKCKTLDTRKSEQSITTLKTETKALPNKIGNMLLLQMNG